MSPAKAPKPPPPRRSARPQPASMASVRAAGTAAALDGWRRLAGHPWLRRLRDDPLATGILLSIVLHALLLTFRFVPPTPLKFAPYDSQIEVVLLNARTDSKPLKPEVLAQVDMEGGGDRDRGRAKSPLPAESKVEDGTDLRRQRQRIAQLEEEQRKLMALSQGPQTYVEPEKNPSPTPSRPLPGVDEQNTEQVIARLQAQIDKQVSDYNKRPKRLTFGVNARGVSYARYVDEWANRVERLGTERYPPAARGRMYDSLICTVEIDKHGNVVDVIINKRSRYDVLNKAVRQIVHAGAPYPKFSPEMVKDGDILQIVRTWTFTNNTLETSAVRRNDR